mmetsp:Transcript_563/g.1269  ORF Transcript_563/g.1269 Transcript_563/m.1269 type:complete len:380 (-) Transcript_563:104-1243(-)
MGGNNSRNLEPGQQLALQLQQAKRQMAGVGLIFRKTDDGSLYVHEIVRGSSADQCGVIQLQDVLSKIDGTKISKCALDEISGMILGDPGDAVQLSFIRPSSAGRWRRKYNISLQRTVRASPQPTYHVQKQGGTTVVTVGHLDCFQQQNTSAMSQHPFGLVSAPMTPHSATPMLTACAETRSNSSSAQSSASSGNNRSPAHHFDDPARSPPPLPTQTQPALAEHTHAPAEQAQPAQEVKRALFVETAGGEEAAAEAEAAPSPLAHRKLSYKLAGLQVTADESKDEEDSMAGSERQEQEEGNPDRAGQGAGLVARALANRMEAMLGARPVESPEKPTSPSRFLGRGVGELVRERLAGGACKAEVGADEARLSSLLIPSAQD